MADLKFVFTEAVPVGIIVFMERGNVIKTEDFSPESCAPLTADKALLNPAYRESIQAGVDFLNALPPDAIIEITEDGKFTIVEESNQA